MADDVLDRLFQLMEALNVQITDDSDGPLTAVRGLLINISSAFRRVVLNNQIWGIDTALKDTLTHEAAHIFAGHKGITVAHLDGHRARFEIPEDIEEEANQFSAAIQFPQNVSDIVREAYPNPIIGDYALAKLFASDRLQARVQRRVSNRTYNLVNNFYKTELGFTYNPVPNSICDTCPFFSKLHYTTASGQRVCKLAHICPRLNQNKSNLDQ